jgi:hypothetical protein
MARCSRRQLPLTSLDSNSKPHCRSKRQKTAGKESDLDDEVLVEGANSEEVGAIATTEEANIPAAEEEANDDAQAEVDNEPPPGASSNEEEEVLWGGPELPTDINLRCIKQIDKYVPKQRGKGKTQPPPTFRMDIALCVEWRVMTSDEQKAAKAEYTGKAAPVKRALKLLVPGSDSVCCRRKTRNNQG